MGSDNRKLLLVFGLAATIRWWLSVSDFRRQIADRVEITTPLNALNRVIEGNHWLDLNVDPYASDIVHESPAHLKFYNLLFQVCGDWLPQVFILLDLLTAYTLFLVGKRYMLYMFIEHTKTLDTYVIDDDNELLKGRDFLTPPTYMACVYLLNPYSIFNCAAQSTTVFSNLLLALFFYGMVHNNMILGALSLALATSQSMYPVVLIAPLYFSMALYGKSRVKGALVCALYLIALALITLYSKSLMNSWNFLANTYGFILQVNDQQPNVGVFWYFFMEMFEHFRLLFVYSYQMNATVVYFVPLTIKFRKDPVMLATCLISLVAIFKSYPSVGDIAFIMALLPCWKHLYRSMQQMFLSCATILVTTALAPVLWDLWIFWGTANANFFFGATLAFITALIFLLTDVAFAYTKRDFLLQFGSGRKINGQDAKLVLE